MEENFLKARILYYAFFSEVFNFIDSKEKYKSIKEKVEFLSKNPINEDDKQALEEMKVFLQKGYESLLDEQNSLFYSPVVKYLPISASYYDENRDDGKKRVQMISIIKKAKFLKDENYKDSEDSIGFIFISMRELLKRSLDMDLDAKKAAKDVFCDILDGFIDKFIFNLHEHQNSNFYKHVAILLDMFMKIERLNYNINSSLE